MYVEPYRLNSGYQQLDLKRSCNANINISVNALTPGPPPLLGMSHIIIFNLYQS